MHCSSQHSPLEELIKSRGDDNVYSVVRSGTTFRLTFFPDLPPSMHYVERQSWLQAKGTQSPSVEKLCKSLNHQDLILQWNPRSME